MSDIYYPAIATITASWWWLLWVKLVGYKTVWCDCDYCVTTVHYKGISYVTNMRAN